MYLTGEKKLSARSVNRKISSVKSFYRFLRKRKIVDRDLFARITADVHKRQGRTTARTIPIFTGV